MNSILFVDDEQDILDGLRSVLRCERARWRMSFALGGEAALAALEAGTFDVIVTDMRMPGMDGLALLEAVRDRHPSVARVVLSGQADLPVVMSASAIAHQYLVKPCEPESLRAVVERALVLQAVLGDPQVRALVGGLGTLPSAPAAYRALSAALGDPDVEIRALAAIVEQDVGLSSRALQLANSAYLGLAQRVSSIEAALRCLGLNTVRHLSLSVEVFRSFGSDAGLDALERHALLTARIARALAPGGAAGEAAFAAGLLHDAGKLVLLSRAPAAIEPARGGAARAAAERAALGADHAGIGAYLLGLWDLPHDVVEPVAFHHAVVADGRGSRDAERIALADALARELAGEAAPDGDGCAAMDALAGSWDLQRCRALAIAATSGGG